MTIEMVLGLKVEMMGDADAALTILREEWERQREPTEPHGLMRVLKNTLDRCQATGIIYPGIFLRRKGEIQRGEFQPRQEVRYVADQSKIIFTAESHPQIPDDWIRQAVKDSVESSRSKYGLRSSHDAPNGERPAPATRGEKL